MTSKTKRVFMILVEVVGSCGYDGTDDGIIVVRVMEIHLVLVVVVDIELLMVVVVKMMYVVM